MSSSLLNATNSNEGESLAQKSRRMSRRISANRGSFASSQCIIFEKPSASTGKEEDEIKTCSGFHNNRMAQGMGLVRSDEENCLVIALAEFVVPSQCCSSQYPSALGWTWGFLCLPSFHLDKSSLSSKWTSWMFGWRRKLTRYLRC